MNMRKIFYILMLCFFAQTVLSAEDESIELPVSFNALMVTLIDHSAHYIWDYGEASKERVLTSNEWQIVEYYAVQLAAAGPLITLNGAGVSDKSWAANPKWKEYAKLMSDAGLESIDAARKKDKAMLLAAGDHLVDSCLNCHAAFKPEVPTEGILHNPEYDHLYHLQRKE